MMLKTMVAFIKKRIKKSTISAINLWAKDGMTYSLPVEKEKGQGRGKRIIHIGLRIQASKCRGKVKSRSN